MYIGYMIKPIVSKKPIVKRKITEGVKLNYGNTGAFKSKVILPPELYGSMGPAKVYRWVDNKKGKLQGRIKELRGVGGTTMIEWGKPVKGSSIKNELGIVTAECATGWGYFDKSHKNGWETGTIYNYMGNKIMKFAHVWNFDKEGTLHMWETLCMGRQISKCQRDLEAVLRGTKTQNETKLEIYYINAPKKIKGVETINMW